MVESTAFKTQAEGLGGVCTRLRVCMCLLGDVGGRGGSVAFDYYFCLFILPCGGGNLVLFLKLYVE